MFKHSEKKFLRYLFWIVLCITPFSMLGKNYRKWIMMFLTNSYGNIFIAPVLSSKGYLKYPTRLFSNIFQSSIIYDYLVCSLLTTWFYRVSYNDNLKTIFSKVWLFSIPQTLLELLLERNTSLIQYKKGWTWIHSLVGITLAKCIYRTLFYVMDRYEEKETEKASQ